MTGSNLRTVTNSTNTQPRTPAYLFTPNIASYCEDCRKTGTRHPGDVLGRTFPHCPECGTTFLTDLRDPWYCALVARISAEVPGLDVLRHMGRSDDADSMLALAQTVEPSTASGRAAKVLLTEDGSGPIIQALANRPQFEFGVTA